MAQSMCRRVDGECDAVYFQEVSGDNRKGLLRLYDGENCWRDAISTLEDLNMSRHNYTLKIA